MVRYRLIKPDWGNASKKDKFIEEIVGPNTIEGDDYSEDFLAEKNAMGYGIYHFPNYNSKHKKGWLSGKDVDVFEWCYVDMDLKDGVYASREEFIDKLLQCECVPYKIVLSGNGVHAYWKVQDLNREKFISLQRRLIRHFKTDDSVWFVSHVMRTPGFYNTKKKDEYKLVEEKELKSHVYSYNDMIKFLPPLEKEDEIKMTQHLRKLDGLEVVPVITEEINGLPEKFEKLLDKNKKVQELFFNEEQGERSERDFALAHILFAEDFTKPEAVAVLSNTPKALSKGQDRYNYAHMTTDKVYKKEAKNTVPSVAEKIKNNTSEKRRGRQIYGPDYFDCTYKGWRTQQCLGIIGGSGSGKSTVTLDIFKEIIRNNPNNDDIFVYFNLEMPDWEIIEKWNALTDGDSKLAERLYVVSNEDEEGVSLNLNVQKIYWYCKDLMKSTGKKIASVAIDHIGVINPTIDIRKKPDFGMIGEMEGAYGSLRNVSIRKLPDVMKQLAKSLDAFVIVQSQTTKAKGMDGDTPLGIDAAYGAAQFEHYMDYVMTIWQPLRRVHDKTDLRVMAWQYCKIRHKHKLDKLDTYSPRIMSVDISNGKIRYLEELEREEFNILNKEASILRKRTEKKEEIIYGDSISLKRLKAISSKG